MEQGPAHLVTKLHEIMNASFSRHSCLCNLIGNHPPNRNPFHCERWVVSALDDCFRHVSKTEFPLPVAADGLEAPIDSWEFTALGFSRAEILRLIWKIFEEFGIPDGIDVEIFQQFLMALYGNYYDNPYHNIYHVVDVLQCCYHLLKHQASRLRCLLTPDDVFALLVACLSHDVGHPSFGNTLLRESQHPLAILFNDTSVLENLHAFVLFSIIRQPCYDFLHNWPEDRRKLFRKRVLSCVLATDMNSHFEFIKKFAADFPTLKDGGERDGLSEEQRGQLCVALIKSSDISNVIRPFPIAQKWGVALINEFLLQGDYERVLGLPMLPLNDRHSMRLSTGQLNFLTIVAAPLYRALADKVGGLELFEEFIAANTQAWRAFDDASVLFEK